MAAYLRERVTPCVTRHGAALEEDGAEAVVGGLGPEVRSGRWLPAVPTGAPVWTTFLSIEATGVKVGVGRCSGDATSWKAPSRPAAPRPTCISASAPKVLVSGCRAKP